MFTSLFVVNTEICSQALMTLIKRTQSVLGAEDNAALRSPTAFFGLSAHQKTWKCYTRWMEHENIPLSAFARAAIISSASWLAALTAQEQSGVWETQVHATQRVHLACWCQCPLQEEEEGEKQIQSHRCDRGWDPRIADGQQREQERED